MRRREFITLLGGATLAWPMVARGQQSERVRRMGVLWGVAPENRTFLSYRMAFTQTLREAGWAEERNVTIDHSGPLLTLIDYAVTRQNWWP